MTLKEDIWDYWDEEIEKDVNIDLNDDSDLYPHIDSIDCVSTQAQDALAPWQVTIRDPVGLRGFTYDGRSPYVYPDSKGRVLGKPPTGWEVAIVAQGAMNKTDYYDTMRMIHNSLYGQVRGERHKSVKVFIVRDYEEYEIVEVWALMRYLEKVGAVVDWNPLFRDWSIYGVDS